MKQPFEETKRRQKPRENFYMHSVVCLFILAFVFCLNINSQNNKKIVEDIIFKIDKNGITNTSDKYYFVAKQFMGKPYVAATLEKNDNEKLVVNLDEFDCTTFVESCIAIADANDYDDFENNLMKIRYRGGVIDNYTSRLHYMSEWIEDNFQLDNITMQLGGEVVNKPLFFMSKNANLYPSLKNNEEEIEKIKKVEEHINNQIMNEGKFMVLPKNKISSIEHMLKDGDIVLFATSIAGLDYSHIGLIHQTKEGVPQILHASSGKSMKVILDEKSLDQYCKSSSKCTGITVLRHKENQNITLVEETE